jgi:hypothetical protein
VRDRSIDIHLHTDLPLNSLPLTHLYPHRVLSVIGLCQRLPDFKLNPLEPIDPLTRMTRLYDEWVRAEGYSATSVPWDLDI